MTSCSCSWVLALELNPGTHTASIIPTDLISVFLKAVYSTYVFQWFIIHTHRVLVFVSVIKVPDKLRD